LKDLVKTLESFLFFYLIMALLYIFLNLQKSNDYFGLYCIADGVRTGARHAILGLHLSHADLGLAPSGFPTGQNIFLLPN
jgi:hypothetical protein